MPLSVQQLLSPPTEAQVLATLLDALESLGFVTTSWQSGSVQRNILTAVARTYAGGADVIRQNVENTLTRPRGAWLDLVGVFRYGLARLPAVKAERVATVVSAASAPLCTFPRGSVISAGTTRFITQDASVTVSPGATETINVIAEFGGVAGNTTRKAVAPGKAGLTITLGTPSVKGVDVESDNRYQTRLDRRYAELTYSIGLRAYELWALTAAPSIRRCKALNNYPDPNAVRVVLDPGEPSEIAQVEAYIAGRNPPNDVVTVSARSTYAQQFVMRPRVTGVVTAEIIETIVRATLDEMPIGGYPVYGGAAGRILLERLAEPLLCRNGVQTAGFQTPSADVVLGATDIVVPSFDIVVERAL